MLPTFRTFWARDAGAASTEAAFAVAALVGVAAVAAFLMLGGDNRQADAPRLAPQEVALTELLDGQIRQFSAAQVRMRLATYLDPSERTASQLRNAHRIWARRVGDRDYSDPDLAADMLAIIERAMQLRGVRPHPGL